MTTQKATIQKRIGECLAEGDSTVELIETIEVEFELTREEAVTEVQEFYADWQELTQTVGLQTADLLQWHIQLRHTLLKKAIPNDNTSQALAILESLALLQGINDIDTGALTPITINLVPKPLEEQLAKGQDVNGDNDNNNGAV